VGVSLDACGLTVAHTTPITSRVVWQDGGLRALGRGFCVVFGLILDRVPE